MESDSSTNSETYMGEEEYPSSRRRRFFSPLPCIAGVLVAEAQAKMQTRTVEVMGAEAAAVASAAAAAAAAAVFMEREHHPKQEGLAGVLDIMSETDFFSNLRVRRESFQHMLDLIHKAYGEQPSGTSLYFGPVTSLYLTLTYLGTQSTYREISKLFGVSQTAVFECVQRVIDVLCEAGKNVFLWPTHNEIPEVEQEFLSMGGIPGVVGAVDGCHIDIKAPSIHQADYIDRTQGHSVILHGVSLPDKRFSYVQIGFPGSAHDSRVLRSTTLFKKITDCDPNYFPSPEYHIVGDSAFGLHEHLMIPFKNTGNLSLAQINYNKKLSRARVTIENAFAFLKGRFRRLKYVDADIERIPKIIKACCVVHNISLSQPGELDILAREGLVDNDVQHISATLSAAPPREKAGVQKRQAIVHMLE